MSENQQNQETTEMKEFDINALPDTKIGDTVKREVPNLDGQTHKVKSVKIVFGEEISKTGTGKDCKRGRIVVELENGYVNGYGGLYQFKQDDGSFGFPTCKWDGGSGSAQLMQKYAKGVGKELSQCSLKELATGLVGKQVKLEFFKTQFNGKVYPKNIITEVLGGTSAPSPSPPDDKAERMRLLQNLVKEGSLTQEGYEIAIKQLEQDQ